MARLLPDWLDAYMAYTAEQESPDEFHLWVGLSTLAGAVQRKVFFDMKYFLLYPNLYTVLVSPAGRCKKSTAMRIGREMLNGVPNANFVSDSTSRERLILDLSQAHKDSHSSMTAYSSEFASLLSTSSLDMMVFLTDIFDSPNEWVHKTKAGGTNKIKAPYLNLLAGTTPDWIAQGLPLDTVGIGLTSRVIFVYHETPRVKDPFPELSEAQIKLKSLLVSDLQQVSVLAGEYKFSPEADAIYREWYKARGTNPNESGDPRLAGYYERKPMHLIKTAMLVTASHSDERVMEAEDLQKAMNLLRRVENDMPKVFIAVGKNPLTVDIEHVTGAIVSAGEEGITYRQLMVMFKHALRKVELDEVMESLSLMGVSKVVQTEDGPRYYIR